MKKAASVIKGCLEEKGMSQRQLARCMGEDVRHLNQQLNRQDDMKVERFIDVLEHIGYRVEVVDNDGIRKVSTEYANKILEEKKEDGLFWTERDGECLGIVCKSGGTVFDMFCSKNECFEWLKKHK